MIMVFDPEACKRFAGEDAEGVKVIFPTLLVENPAVRLVPLTVIPVMEPRQAAFSVKVMSNGPSIVADDEAARLGGLKSPDEATVPLTMISLVRKLPVLEADQP